MTLSPAQQAHVNSAYPECRDQIADYLKRGVDVVIFKQNECGDDTPPFAVAPKDDLGFWLGCWDTQELAAEGATALGLRIVSN
ncbi:TPA: hypothetical protein L4559_003501 [Pseudomonas aeruginosa]|nr:hypothetical protein [Pseudomonas aeruginosa]